MPGGGIGAGAQADATVWGGMGGIVPGATLEGQLAAGAIPSDPVLAMQMGARMALSGKLVLPLCRNRDLWCKERVPQIDI